MLTGRGHHFAQYEEAATPVPRLVGSAHGLTLEVGVGDGNQLARYDVSRVTRVIGIEPNGDLLARLRQRLASHSELASKYTPIQAALEDSAELLALNVTDGSVDTIVCMQVLCSVRDCQAGAATMYKLLKPGGQLLFWEHHLSPDTVTSWAQVGGCHLNRDIQQALDKAGSWAIDEVGHDSQGPYDLMPRFWGRLTKTATIEFASTPVQQST
ncbi:hypothetical protein LTR95_017151 [Oleoguttula sp. CCFEE 5521]